MDHNKVLNIGAFPDDHVMVFCPNNRVGPNGGIFFHTYLAIEQGCGVDEGGVIQSDIWAKTGQIKFLMQLGIHIIRTRITGP